MFDSVQALKVIVRIISTNPFGSSKPATQPGVRYMKPLMPAVIAILALSLSMSGAHAGPEDGDKPYLFTSQSENFSAQVEAIDHATREVTLLGPEGNAISFVAGEEVRNLDQVEVGDIVNVEMVQNLSIEVYDAPGVAPTENQLTAEERAEPGEKPGITTVDVQVVSATVVAIDLEDNTFKLQWPDGSIGKFTARDPDNLREAAIGDLVVITQTDRVSIFVQGAD